MQDVNWGLPVCGLGSFVAFGRRFSLSVDRGLVREPAHLSGIGILSSVVPLRDISQVHIDVSGHGVVLGLLDIALKYLRSFERQMIAMASGAGPGGSTIQGLSVGVSIESVVRVNASQLVDLFVFLAQIVVDMHSSLSAVLRRA